MSLSRYKEAPFSSTFLSEHLQDKPFVNPLCGVGDDVDSQVYTRAVQTDGESRLKKAAFGIGGYAIGLIVLVLGLFLIVLLLRGMVWASEKLMPWLVTASGIALLICILIFLPLCIFRRTRPWAGVGYFYASYVFGAMLFAYSCLFVVFAWGYGALAIGLIFAGVGVVPVALLAAIFHAEWSVLWELVLGIVLTFGTRGFGIWLTTKAEREEDAVANY